MADMLSRSLSRTAAAACTALLAAVPAAQEIPGVRASLAGRTLVTAGANVELKLYLEVQADAEVPAELLTGLKLTVKTDGEARPPITQPGKPGTVPLAAGTRLERTFTLPATSFLASPDVQTVTSVIVGIDGLAGTSFEFKVAPDTRKIDVATLDLAKTQVVLVTSLGEMRVSFRPDKAPKAVESFVKLCLQGFYDGTKFHRVIRNFMIQGGDPNSKDDAKPETWGQGNPGFFLEDEFNDLRHLRGTLSMANTGRPNSSGSQFFVMHKENPSLDNKYIAFGNLESGADTLDRIANTPVGPRDAPLTPVVLHSAVVLPVKK
jgi:peptidyl-prolyl cis-trans isomerase B (cyclophilin B)